MFEGQNDFNGIILAGAKNCLALSGRGPSAFVYKLRPLANPLDTQIQNTL